MDEHEWLSERFEQDRSRLRAVAYRMLGSAGEAEDAVQEAWLRASRAETGSVDNLNAWLTTVVARVSLNMLRSRNARRETPFDGYVPEQAGPQHDTAGPEQEAVLADSVGLALLVVLDTLAPAERLAFVLHDMFDLPFDEIAPIVDRSPAAARQLASRARRRVKGADATPSADLDRQRSVVNAFLAATRGGDFDALVTLLDPDVVLRADKAVIPTPEPVELRGANTVAESALAATGRARLSNPALINGRPGIVMAPHGRPRLTLTFTITAGKIAEIDITANPERLRNLEITALE